MGNLQKIRCILYLSKMQRIFLDGLSVSFIIFYFLNFFHNTTNIPNITITKLPFTKNHFIAVNTGANLSTTGVVSG